LKTAFLAPQARAQLLPSKPGFDLLGRKAAKRAQKFLCRAYAAQFLSQFSQR
jgi:hypothetical protein